MSAVVIHGVTDEENPLLSTVWGCLGQPVLSIPLPLWVKAESIPQEMNGHPRSPLCNLIIEYKAAAYSGHLRGDALNTYYLRDGNGSGLLEITSPLWDLVFASTDSAMTLWREEMPETETVRDFQNQLSEHVYQELSAWTRPTLRTVPDEIATIQEAINMSVDGDTVLILPGTYSEMINFNGRNIVVGSLYLLNHEPAYIDSTILDGQDNDGRSIALFRSKETNDAILIGFTLQNASTGYGGAIYINDSSPMLKNLLIKNNNATRDGGAIYCTQSSSPTLDRLTIVNNTSDGTMGSIRCFDDDSQPVVQNCIVRDNTPADLPPDRNITYCNIDGDYNGIGNIDVDPMFIDAENDNFHLRWDNHPEDDQQKSPCIDAGKPDTGNDPDSTRADMGAFYFDQGVPQDIAFNVESIQFVDVHLNSMEEREILILNEGERTLSVSSQSVITIEGPPFIFINDGGGEFALQPGDTHTTVIAINPLFIANYNALFRVESDDPYDPRVEIPVNAIWVGVEDNEKPIPSEFEFFLPYPNPFNNHLQLSFKLPITSPVTIHAFDQKGRFVSEIVNKSLNPGMHRFTWNPADLSAGVYWIGWTMNHQSGWEKAVYLK